MNDAQQRTGTSQSGFARSQGRRETNGDIWEELLQYFL